MKKNQLIHSSLIVLLGIALTINIVFGQSQEVQMDLSQVSTSSKWKVHNRTAQFKDNVLEFNAQPKDGIAWNQEINLANGIIEVDIKGENLPGRSFVGIAFHGVDEERFEAVYFRPFNFKNPAKKVYSLQYISHPDNSWPKLRRDSPGVYENEIAQAPGPDEWFHVKIDVNYPKLEVFVNDEVTPSLKVKQLGRQGQGWVGLWAGNNSMGWFKNLRIIKR